MRNQMKIPLYGNKEIQKILKAFEDREVQEIFGVPFRIIAVMIDGRNCDHGSMELERVIPAAGLSVSKDK